MRRGLAWLGGALGLAAWLRLRRRSSGTFERRDSDPADELRAKLDQARAVADDRDEFDAAEGQAVDEVEQPRSIEERRRAIHDKAQQALGEMNGPDSGK
jgi:hypothetical protein